MRTLILLLATFCLVAQDGAKEVTWDMAFRNASPSLSNRTGRFVSWLDNQTLIYRETNGSLVTLNPKTGDKKPYSTPIEVGRGIDADLTSDFKMWTWLEEGDLFLQKEGSEKRQLTGNPAEEKTPTFSPDSKSVAYTRSGNLFVLNLASGLERQLTSDGTDLITNGYASWVYYEEILGRDSNYRAFWWSPDSKKIAFLRFDDHPVGSFLIYHPDGNYGTWEKTRYPKSGEDNPLVKFGVLDLESGKTTWLDFDPNEDAYLAWPFWTPDSKKLHVQWLNRDQNHLKIMECDPHSGSVKPIYEEQQKTWVEYFADITYIKDGFILRSDKDGFNHLYLHNMDGSLKTRLTSGDWRVRSILSVDQDQKKVFFTANQHDSAGTDVFSVGFNGKNLKQLTSAFSNKRDHKGGSHSWVMSPDHTKVAGSYTDFWTPTVLYWGDVKKQDWNVLETGTSEDATAYEQGEVEYFRIPGPDGHALPAFWVLPPDLDESGKTKYGVIFRIYSGPDAPTVVDRFRQSWREHYYAKQGVITISVDHRASGHFGKKGVNAMYRSMGQCEVVDLNAAVAWLREKPFIDATKIGITGHSYGGYMTLLAMTKGAEYFTHGVAGAPVTDWSLYDTVYTERYMDTPQDNPEGYKEGSVMTHAELLKGPIRLLHGGIDDNVHFQNSAQLVEAWTMANKDFEFMLYPSSRHGIRAFRHRSDAENRFWFRHFLNRDFKP